MKPAGTAPRVSVVIPNYNHAKLLPRCLDAILSQSVLPDEILVLDDASTDHSRDVIADYARRSDRIRPCPNERNLGVVATMNRGLGLATGDYVGFFAADDEILPGLFEHALPMIAAHPGAGAVSGLCEWRCQATGQTWYQGSRMPQRAGYFSPDEMIGLGRSGQLTIAGQHALFKKSALVEAGGWIPELRWFTDCFATWVIGFRNGICFVPRPMSVFYLYPTSYYNSAQSRAERRQTMDLFLRLLEGDRYTDVLPRLRRAGVLGGFGWPMLQLAIADPRHRHLLNLPFVRHAARRTAEVIGRRFFPGWLAKLCLRLFYGRK